MSVSSGRDPPSEAINLARERDFRLGEATIRPPLSEVVCGSTRIRLQPRIMQVLVALARARGEVLSRDDLVVCCWGGVVVGDDALNRCIQRLRRLSEEIPNAFLLETLPRVGYRLTAWKVGPDPPEPPPEKAAAASDQIPSTPAPLRPSAERAIVVTPGGRARPRPVLAAAVAIMAVAAVGVLMVRLGKPPLEGVALRPFEVGGDSPIARTFASSVSYEVASALSNAGVKVIGPDAPGDYRKAAFVLVGQAELPGSDLHLATALEDARDHAVLWSASFTRPSGEVRAMQEQVAAKIGDVLHCALDARSYPGGRIDLDTVRLYLRACDLQRNDRAQGELADIFRQVAARRPDFSLAWSKLAVATVWAAFDLPPDQAKTAEAQARADAEKALRLNPKDGFAYVALADLALGPRHLAEHYDVLRKGLAVAPDNSELARQEGLLLERLGRLDEAVAFLRRAVALDPFSASKASDLVFGLADDGRLSEARTVADRAIQIWPDDPGLKAERFSIELRYGDPNRALALLDDLKTRLADNASDARLESYRRLLQARKVHDPAAVATFAGRELADLRSGKLVPGDAVLDLANIGAVDAAFTAAAAAPFGHWDEPFTTSDPLDPEVLFRPFAEGLRRDPRFIPLAVRIGIADFWMKTDQWPDFCAIPNWPYDCRAAVAKALRH